ncbi:Dof zinc finger protein [Quillaja saponaria]|uniref:Dof zinc finger protein n=1 Tax=Quillaja saponaria TaxID=32244 RepID=A0AAD7M244_QUISA|nr:Dof zinc finger protein [Quillaja saponaria]
MKRQQQQNQQGEPLNCPRACKRHWTKGGTLRNVPVGGGRKNKRVKRSNTSTSATTSTTTITNPISSLDNRLNTHMEIQIPQQRHSLSLSLGDQKNLSGVLYTDLIRPPSLLPQQNQINNTSNNAIFLGSTLPLGQNQNLGFPFSSSSSFDTNISSITTSFQSSSIFNYVEEFKTMEEPTINSIMACTSGTNAQAAHVPVPTTGSGMDMSNYWNWEDIDSLVSTDLNLPWDDSDTKP